MDKNKDGTKSDRPPMKEAIMIWDKAVQDFDNGNFEDSRDNFAQIMEICSRISYSIGAVHYRNGEYSKAILNFIKSTNRDAHMALSHFGLGLCYAQEGQHNKARQCYEKARECLRGNPKIDYTQLGLKFSLWDCDIIYNMALNLATMTTEKEWAMEILSEALEKAKQEKQRARINQAIISLTENQLFDPVQIPDDVFRPPQGKVENLKDINYLGESTVISTMSIRKTTAEKPTAVQGNTKNGRSLSPSKKTTNSFSSSLPPPPNTVTKPILDGVEKMSLRDSLTIWHEGVLAFESGDIDHALDEWLKIQDPSAKILYNITIVQMQHRDYEGARKTCHGIINKDQHLAIGHSLLGEVHCMQGRFDDAWNSFGRALGLLRKKNFIDYTQLGLPHRLYKCEVLVNQAYCYQQSGTHEWVKKLLDEALACKKGPRQVAVEKAAKNASEGRQIECCSIPLNIVFKPPKSKIDNLAQQNFLGTSTVVSVLKGTDEKANATTNRQVSTPPSVPSPAPPVIRAPPPAPVLATTTHIYDDTPPLPTRTSSRGQDSGRSTSPGPPNRLPPTIPIHRSKSPNTRGPPSKNVPPSPKPNHGTSDEYEEPVSPPATTTHPKSSPQGSPVRQKKGPPNKSLPPPPTRDPSSSSSMSSSMSSTPSTSPRSQSPPLEPRPKTSSGPPRKALPPPPTRVPPSVPQSRSHKPGSESRGRAPGGPPSKPLPPNPLSSSPKSSSPRSLSPVKAFDNSSGPRGLQRTKVQTKTRSGIVTVSYEAQVEGELAVMEGDLVKILSQDGDWTVGEVGGKQGIFPTRCVKSHSINRSDF